jgi:hypothetical protein
VSQILDSKGWFVLDCDQITKQLYQKQATTDAISINFGSEFVVDGRVDTKKLGAYVFADQSRVQKLNQVMHPLIFAELDKEYEEFHSKANNAYCEYCQKNGQLFDLVRFNSKGHIENLFANAKISRCRNEIIKVANCVEWKMVDTAVHLPDDYDERNKFIRSKPFIVQDALYNGECKDFVKVAGCEWFICTVHEEVRIPVLELTDRNSMRNAFESLMEILENLIERKTMSFSEWRAEMGI